MPNAKKLHILKEKNIISPYKRPYKLCTFSRVMKQKGINDIVKAVKEINKLYNEVIFLLDIYGPVDPLYKNEFTEMCKNFPKYIRYCGCVPSDESTSVLSDYYALVFPTRFYTEGIPGTIIDAFSSGLPVISSKWQNFSDLIDDGITGIGYDFGSYKHLKSTLIEIIANPKRLINMKKNCIREAEKYSIDKAISILLEQV